ncbi:hypothetical protein AUEXF2481DRAFT_294251 [Aureobasidium subglaciale EXF-2481]|uniref:Uncharacterized protein n=1 Tax=Aureobasidium subglaciale (strain EXF-2481) TaxID=1043005 RepID=A0A074YJ98_AURSE|nr:uncharacterized protein AUEXF2481DRAFT_294251 [Aureobasidium subglaciale EXF-2481]KEQ94147.1 hypothetical protein AUEXF2481DRAFT_294251 [Aureobasidium subglaciale EXF-2481]
MHSQVSIRFPTASCRHFRGTGRLSSFTTSMRNFMYMRLFRSYRPYRDVPSFYQKLKAYPELYAKYKEAHGMSKELYARVKASPELIKSYNEWHRASMAIYMASIDAETAMKNRARALASHHLNKHNDRVIKWRRINNWCFREGDASSWIREMLPWKHFRPIRAKEPIECQCASCLNWFKRRNWYVHWITVAATQGQPSTLWVYLNTLLYISESRALSCIVRTDHDL